ncbi:MAG: PIN domain-containing protein [Proteobacteria bacterium]|nr:PIN domain-containing protein [Pseudomonadota bacterium]
MGNRIFFDTNPIIYYLETHTDYSDIVLNFIIKQKALGAEFYTSTITNAEYLYKPFREQRLDLVRFYSDFLNIYDFKVSSITESIALKSAQLRSKYSALKLPEALQLAAAIECQCNTLLTNDERLSQVVEANVLCLDRLMNKS